MKENYDIWDFELSKADMDAIAALDTGKSSFFDQRDPDTAEWLTRQKFH